MNLNTKEAIEKLGYELKGKFARYVSDRSGLEQQWLKNLRQYKGKYDPEIEAKIPADRSKVYPKDTHTKVTGFVAKMMEMMFPASDMNWDVLPTAHPNIPQIEINRIITDLQNQKLQAQDATPVTSDEIEAEVQKFARDRAFRMRTECIDQLSDIGGEQIEYSQLCKKAVRSGAIYGFGVLDGPQVRMQIERSWAVNPLTGLTEAVVKEVPRPYYEFVRVWDIYPDLAARTWREQEGIFRRYVFTRYGLRQLANREDFKTSTITEYLRDNQTGNYSVPVYESDLEQLRHTTNVTKNDKRKYEVIRYYGYLSGKELEQAGISIPEANLDTDVLADVWLLDDKVIKIDTAPFGENPADIYHAFIYEDDEDSSLTGTGLTEVLRDAQMRLCAADRATQDNMAMAAVPIMEINDDLIARGYEISRITGGATVHREGLGADANAPALRQVAVNSHISELLNLRQSLVQIMDMESNLPSWLMGNAQPLGEAFRTSNNMSMMQGGANMLTKDIVRSFDRFTSSVIGSLVRWNMEFNPKEEIKGDYQVQAKGNLSLVAKEIRGAAMDQMLQVMTEDERAIMKTRETLEERLKARDLPTDLILPEKEAMAVLARRQEAQAQIAQAAQAEQAAKTQKMSSAAQKDQVMAQATASQNEAKIAEILSRVEANLANAKGVKDRGQLEHIKLLLESIQQRSGAGTGGMAPEQEAGGGGEGDYGAAQYAPTETQGPTA